MAEKLLLLGATGSIGRQTLDLLKYSSDYDLVGLSFRSRWELLEPYLLYFPSLRFVAIEDEESAAAFHARHPSYVLLTGKDCSLALMERAPAETVFNALMGTCGLLPSLLAIEKGEDLLLSNKESLVLGSSLIAKARRSSPSRLYPVDSEHVALAKLLAELERRKIPRQDILELVVTASGGALRDWKREDLAKATPADVLRHPTWSMGRKITVDSATMVNKGYEAIEASVLFDFPLSKVSALICRESLVHALVRYREGEQERWIYEYSPVDMKVAIGYALSKGRTRWHENSAEDEEAVSRLHFERLDSSRYPLFGWTKEVFLRYGNPGMLLYDAVDSLAIERFLQQRITYLGIEEALLQVPKKLTLPPQGLVRDELAKAQEAARRRAAEIVDEIEKGEHRS